MIIIWIINGNFMRSLYESLKDISDMKEYILNSLDSLSKEEIEKIYNIVLKSNVRKMLEEYLKYLF